MAISITNKEKEVPIHMIIIIILLQVNVCVVAHEPDKHTMDAHNKQISGVCESNTRSQCMHDRYYFSAIMATTCSSIIPVVCLLCMQDVVRA